MVNLGEKEEFTHFIAKVIPFFEDCLSRKAALITNSRDLVTIIYLIDSIALLRPLP